MNQNIKNKEWVTVLVAVENIHKGEDYDLMCNFDDGDTKDFTDDMMQDLCCTAGDLYMDYADYACTDIINFAVEIEVTVDKIKEYEDLDDYYTKNEDGNLDDYYDHLFSL